MRGGFFTKFSALAHGAAVHGILHPNKRGLEPNMSIWKHWAHSLKIDINYLDWVIYQV